MEISIKILAAALSACIDLKMVALSFVKFIDLFRGPEETGTRILPLPLQQKVVLTKSVTAIAPTNDN